MLSIVIDIHCNILSAQCCVKYAVKNLVDRMKVEVNSNHLFISLFSGSVLYKQITIVTPSNFFIPMTFKTLEDQNNSIKMEIKGEETFVKSDFKLQDILLSNATDKEVLDLEATFRLQISSDRVIKDITADSKPNPSIVEYFKSKVLLNVPYNVLCANCNTILSSTSFTFTSIEDFPGDYSELSETWFCHKHPEHSHHHNTDFSSILYVSQIYFYLQHSMVDKLLFKEDREEYKCIKCSSFCTEDKVNSITSGFTKFFCDKIKFHALDSSTNDIFSYKNEIATFSLIKLVESALQASFCCKLYLQNKVANEDNCLLLWVTSQKVAQFFLQVTSDAIPSETFLKTKEMYKVLYCICAPSCNTVHSWKHDFNVDFYRVSDSTFKIICELLKESTKYIQNSQVPLNSFSLGYIPVHASIT